MSSQSLVRVIWQHEEHSMPILSVAILMVEFGDLFRSDASTIDAHSVPLGSHLT